MILCDTGNFESGVPGHVVESALGWMKTGDSVAFHVEQNGTTWVNHKGHEYQFALHGLSDVVEEKQVFLLSIVN